MLLEKLQLNLNSFMSLNLLWLQFIKNTNEYQWNKEIIQNKTIDRKEVNTRLKEKKIFLFSINLILKAKCEFCQWQLL